MPPITGKAGKVAPQLAAVLLCVIFSDSWPFPDQAVLGARVALTPAGELPAAGRAGLSFRPMMTADQAALAIVTEPVTAAALMLDV